MPERALNYIGILQFQWNLVGKVLRLSYDHIPSYVVETSIFRPASSPEPGKIYLKYLAVVSIHLTDGNSYLTLKL